MNISSQELKQVSKLDEKKSEPKTLKELFSGEEEPVVTETIKQYLEAHCQKEIKKYFEERTKEHEMSMKERQAGINASHAITGVITTWAIVGITMLARSCINFDKGPKFKVD